MTDLRTPPGPMRLLIVGGTGGTAIGQSLLRAAERIQVSATQLDSAEAYRGAWLPRSLSWRVRGHRPFRLEEFSDLVRQRALELSTRLVLATGLAPVSEGALRAIRAAGAQTACYLTDDPWNPAHRAPWFFRALSEYDAVYTPRESNLGQLKAVCRGNVEYLPFGYDETLFFSDSEVPPDSGADLLFVGTCDSDRAPILGALRQARIGLRVFGSYYDRWPATRGLSEGQADAATIRRATIESKICLCLVRRSNRDGHVMRSLEMAACGACMLVEDTVDHRRFFGADGHCARYFQGIDSMIASIKALLDAPAERARMRASVLSLLHRESHSYTARLQEIVRRASAAAGPSP